MSSDTLQWIAIIGIFAWLLMISLWIGETTELLKTWWSDFLRDVASKEYRERLEKVRKWGPKKQKPEPWRRGTRIEPIEPWPDPPKRNGDD